MVLLDLIANCLKNDTIHEDRKPDGLVLVLFSDSQVAMLPEYRNNFPDTPFYETNKALAGIVMPVVSEAGKGVLMAYCQQSMKKHKKNLVLALYAERLHVSDDFMRNKRVVIISIYGISRSGSRQCTAEAASSNLTDLPARGRGIRTI